MKRFLYTILSVINLSLLYYFMFRDNFIYFCSYKTEYKIVQGHSRKRLYLHVLEEIWYSELVHNDAEY
jgi:hypothetical protein